MVEDASLPGWSRKTKPAQERYHGAYELKIGEKSLRFRQGKDAANVGHQVWDGGIKLAKYIEHQVKTGRCDLRGKKIVELGAGTGIVGLACAVLGASVIITDLDGPVTDLLRENVAENAHAVQGQVKVMPLDFFRQEQAAAVASEFADNIDIIVAADVIYFEVLANPLINTLKFLSAKGSPVIYLAFTVYRLSPLLEFFRTARRIFQVHGIKDEDHHPAFRGAGVYLKRLERKELVPAGTPEGDVACLAREIQIIQEAKAKLFETIGDIEWRSIEALVTATDVAGGKYPEGHFKVFALVDVLAAEKAKKLEELGALEWRQAEVISQLKELGLRRANAPAPGGRENQILSVISQTLTTLGTLY